MIADLKPYPAMKNSGAPWLGQVPEHWDVLPNRALFDEIKDRDRPDEQMLSVTIKGGVIRQAALLQDTSKKDSSNLDRSNYKLVRPGDIVYNKMRAWQGAVGVSDYRGIVSPAYVVQRPRAGAVSRYFHHLLRTPGFAKEAERWSYGITSDMWSLRPEHFKMIYACLPALPEQTAIVRYLDYVERRVRRYIQAKQRLIGLLEEQKQAIIHRAVTRGLEPDVPLKPSGVEWLGDVPEPWEVRRLKSLLAARVTDGPHTTPTFLSEGIPFLSVDGIQHGELVFDNCRYVSPEDHAEFQEKAAPRRNDILLGKAASTGKIARVKVEFEFSIWSPLALIRPRASLVHSAFLEYALKDVSAQAQVEILCTSNTQKNISMADIPRLTVPLPPLHEQGAIVEHLHKATADIDTAIDRTRRELELIREYRTRLIADVVTGKLDVREAAANLPHEPDEPEPLDEIDDLTDESDGLADDLDAVPLEVEV